MKKSGLGVDDNTIVMSSTTDNGTENFTWPDGGQTPFFGGKGTGYEGGFRAPAMIRSPGQVPAGTAENGIISGMDWLPTFVAAAGNPNIKQELLKGKKIGGRTYKNHLDGYSQMDMITGKGRRIATRSSTSRKTTSPRCGLMTSSIASLNQPIGWIGSKIHVDAPVLTKPAGSFCSDGMAGGDDNGSYEYFGCVQYEFWRFVFVQQEVVKLAMTAKIRRCRRADL